MSKEKLLTDFPPVSTEDWEKVIHADLKGADYAKKLIWNTYEGIQVKPYYRMEDLQGLEWLLNALPGEFPYVRGNQSNGNDWEIRAEIFNADLQTANAAALRNLSRGVNGICFRSLIKDGKMYGQPVQKQDDFNALIAGIDLTKTPVHLDWGARGAQALALLVNAAESQNIALTDLKGSLQYDVMAELLQQGFVGLSREAWKSSVARLVQWAAEKTPLIRPVTVQAHAVHHAGGNAVQELAYALGAGIEYMDSLTEAGMTAQQAAQKIGFSFSVGPNYFFEIAKVRAFRVVWASILQQMGVEGVKTYVHGRTSEWNMTLFDPNVNMLRASTEAMSAVIGGYDALTVLPYDCAFKTPDEFSYRIARNTQLMLKYESQMEKLVDPASGSFYVESITDQLAQAALEMLKGFDAQGGLMAVILSGELQKQVAAVQAKKDKNISSRRDVFLGTNQFPNLLETMSSNLSIAEPAEVQGDLDCPCADVQGWRDEFLGSACACSEGEACDCGEESKAEKICLEADALDIRRGAEVFEKMRLATEAFGQKTGKTPTVFLWTAGNLAMRLARATFVKNFFGCAGYQAVDTNGIQDAEEGLALASKTNPEIFVLCSSDDEYLELAQAVVPSIRQAYPKALIVVAGAPACVDELKAAGVNDLVNVRTNAIELLSDYQVKLGVN